MIADPVPVLEVEGRTLPVPMSWSLSTDLLQPADAFSCELPLFVAPEHIPTDGRITLRLGRATAFSGRIDSVQYTARDTWSVEARDGIGRLVDESVPGAGWTVGRGSLTGEILRIVEPWFSSVVYSNAEDRVLRRGSRRGLARAAREPVTAAELRAIGRVVDAGSTRWDALQRLLVPLGLLAWSSADGRSLIVARPNYSQAVQYRFFKTPGGSNVLDMDYSRSVAERFSTVVVSGSARSQGGLREPRLTTPGQPRRKRVVLRSLGRATDDSGDFRAEKRRFVIDSTVYPQEAQARAERLLGQQRTRAEEIAVTVPGLGQSADMDRAFVLYAPDTLAAIRLETARDSNSDRAATVVDGVYYITRVDYQSDATSSRTRLALVPKGSVLV